MTQAIEHPGFGFVQVLSPCQTFRPEQKHWKQMVHPCQLGPTHDAARAAELIQRDDGMALGILYAEQLPIYSSTHDAHASLDLIEAEFEL